MTNKQIGAKRSLQVYFSDFFGVAPNVLENYGAFNVSLINDLPLFIDPFLLFESEKKEYRDLHDEILKYLGYLRDKAAGKVLEKGLVEHLFVFPEVKQNWLGYSLIGNEGRGLGSKFAQALSSNLNTVFSSFGKETITKGSHLEKLCIIRSGVGRDNVSDFTTNLLKNFLLSYTEKFALENLRPTQVKQFKVEKAIFSYKSGRWLSKNFTLPNIAGDYVLLTPKDLLTKDENWINSRDIFGNFGEIANSIPNEQLRALINEHFRSALPPPPSREKKKGRKSKKEKPPSKKEIAAAITQVIEKFPEFLDYYIKFKEDRGDDAKALSRDKVALSEHIFIEQLRKFVILLDKETDFYVEKPASLEEARRRVDYLKHVIENNDGYRVFYVKDKPVKRESDLQVMFRLVWYVSSYEVDAEVNNGRGPADFKVSRGRKNKALVEFKLASNTALKKNLQHQVAIYERANQTQKSLKVILYFSLEEREKVNKVLKELSLQNDMNIILIDARQDNKVSASKARG